MMNISNLKVVSSEVGVLIDRETFHRLNALLDGNSYKDWDGLFDSFRGQPDHPDISPKDNPRVANLESLFGDDHQGSVSESAKELKKIISYYFNDSVRQLLKFLESNTETKCDVFVVARNDYEGSLSFRKNEMSFTDNGQVAYDELDENTDYDFSSELKDRIQTELFNCLDVESVRVLSEYLVLTKSCRDPDLPPLSEIAPEVLNAVH